jgi:Flp pilus assembly protein TadD
MGNLELAEKCWELTRRITPNHSEACNNLAVLALLEGKIQEGKALLNVRIKFNYLYKHLITHSFLGMFIFE